jgi:hypothetical protein
VEPVNPALALFSADDTRSIGSLRHRYHELLKLYHPDGHGGRAEWANQMVRCVIAAYNTLKGAVGKAVRIRETEGLGGTMAAADQDLLRAVLLGWLRHGPRAERDGRLRRRLAFAVREVDAHPEAVDSPGEAALQVRLLSAFLEATAPCPPLAYTWNASNAYRDLRVANAFLEKGIRDYYHHRERGRLNALGAVAFSYLRDASRYYSYVARRLPQGPLRDVTESRMTVAGLFQERIRLANTPNDP